VSQDMVAKLSSPHLYGLPPQKNSAEVLTLTSDEIRRKRNRIEGLHVPNQ
jgi:hypothetical protein